MFLLGEYVRLEHTKKKTLIRRSQYDKRILSKIVLCILGKYFCLYLLVIENGLVLMNYEFFLKTKYFVHFKDKYTEISNIVTNSIDSEKLIQMLRLCLLSILYREATHNQNRFCQRFSIFTVWTQYFFCHYWLNWFIMSFETMHTTIIYFLVGIFNK